MQGGEPAYTSLGFSTVRNPAIFRCNCRPSSSWSSISKPPRHSALPSRKRCWPPQSPSPLTMLFSRHTKRREFIAGLGSAAAWPALVRAQQGDRVRRVGVLMWFEENDPGARFSLSVFTQALAGMGWTDGRNVRMDVRWYGDDINRIRALAQELVGLKPDIILTNTTAATVAVQRETRTIPIVFANVGDPVASGIVARLDRPGGNTTGFASYE